MPDMTGICLSNARSNATSETFEQLMLASTAAAATALRRAAPP